MSEVEATLELQKDLVRHLRAGHPWVFRKAIELHAIHPSVVGIGLGALIAFVLQGKLGFPARVSPQILMGGLALSTVVGIVAGDVPARSASNLTVVDALRDET